MNPCFTIFVLGGMFREKKIIKSKMRKAFYNKIFCPPSQKKINSALLLV